MIRIASGWRAADLSRYTQAAGCTVWRSRVSHGTGPRTVDVLAAPPPRSAAPGQPLLGGAGTSVEPRSFVPPSRLASIGGRALHPGRSHDLEPPPPRPLRGPPVRGGCAHAVSAATRRGPSGARAAGGQVGLDAVHGAGSRQWPHRRHADRPLAPQRRARREARLPAGRRRADRGRPGRGGPPLRDQPLRPARDAPRGGGGADRRAAPPAGHQLRPPALRRLGHRRRWRADGRGYAVARPRPARPDGPARARADPQRRLRRPEPPRRPRLPPAAGLVAGDGERIGPRLRAADPQPGALRPRPAHPRQPVHGPGLHRRARHRRRGDQQRELGDAELAQPEPLALQRPARGAARAAAQEVEPVAGRALPRRGGAAGRLGAGGRRGRAGAAGQRRLQGGRPGRDPRLDAGGVQRRGGHPRGGPLRRRAGAELGGHPPRQPRLRAPNSPDRRAGGGRRALRGPLPGPQHDRQPVEGDAAAGRRQLQRADRPGAGAAHRGVHGARDRRGARRHRRPAGPPELRRGQPPGRVRDRGGLRPLRRHRPAHAGRRPRRGERPAAGRRDDAADAAGLRGLGAGPGPRLLRADAPVPGGGFGASSR